MNRSRQIFAGPKKIRYLLAALALLLIVLGIMSGEAGTVFEKGARVCLECIGIG